MYNPIFTFELLFSILKASIFFNTSILEPVHILGGILLTDNLVTKLLNLNKEALKKFLLQLNKNNIPIKFTLSKIQFSQLSLHIFSKLLKTVICINTLDFVNALIYNNYKYNKFIIKFSNILDFSYLKKYYWKQSNIIASEFSLLCKKHSNYIVERSKEINDINSILNKNLYNTPILVGSKGIGKLSILKSLYLHNKYKQQMKKFYLIDYIKLKEIYTSTNLLENGIYNIQNWLLTINPNCILIFPELEEFYTNSQEICMKFFEYLNSYKYIVSLKKIITINNTILITNNSLKNFLQKFFSYEIYWIKEPTSKENLNILKSKSLILSKYYNLKVSHDDLLQVINLSKKYIKNNIFPIKGIQILDKACSLQTSTNKTGVFDYQFIKKAISIETSLPLNIIDKNITKNNNNKNIELILKNHIFGQDKVLTKISNSLKRTLSGIKSPNKPLGSWLLCGPSGTGKTELAKILSKILIGSESTLVRFDMSEYMEKHSLSKLIGSPPGYIGYGEKGQLTSAIEKTPFCIVLFDEIEKAHSSIANIMLQILDDGRLTDSTGQIIDFTETIILFTSNLGCPKEISGFNVYKDSNNRITYKVIEHKIYAAIKNYFKPEFINRLQDILIFQPLNEFVLVSIIDKFLKQFKDQLKELKVPITLIIDSKFKLFISKLSSSPIYGARPLKRLLDELIADPLIEIILNLELKNPSICYYNVDLKNNKIIYSILSN